MNRRSWKVRIASGLQPVCAFLCAFLVFLTARGCGGGDGAAPAEVDAGSSGFGPGADGGFAADCVNLCRQQVTCVDSTTSVSGVVHDPAGKLPVANAIVYVPNAPVGEVPASPTCDRCGTVAGKPLVATLTDAQGAFVLKNMPAGHDIPLVIQVGKWRRQLVLPNVPSCADTPLTALRLPRTRQEGDLPRIALATGGEDALECLLRKVGIADTEFTTEAGEGAVHLFAGAGSPVTAAFNAANGARPFPSASTLWSDPVKLARYDVLLLGCEGQTAPASKPAAALAAVAAYANHGGRVFASHWQRFWFSTKARTDDAGVVLEPAGSQVASFDPFATWTDRADPRGPVSGALDVTYAKPKALAAWLAGPEVAALDAGSLPFDAPHRTVDAVDARDGMATSWITFADPNAGPSAVALLSSNMPSAEANAKKCGRIVYTALDVAVGDARGPAWPDGCTSANLTAQEKAIEYMLFDLSSCIQDDRAPPLPPAFP